MKFLWGSYGMSIVFLGHFYAISVGFLCVLLQKMCFNDNPKGFLCSFYWFLWDSCGIAMGFLWDVYDISLEFLCGLNSVAVIYIYMIFRFLQGSMEFLWNFFGIPMAFLYMGFLLGLKKISFWVINKGKWIENKCIWMWCPYLSLDFLFWLQVIKEN